MERSIYLSAGFLQARVGGEEEFKRSTLGPLGMARRSARTAEAEAPSRTAKYEKQPPGRLLQQWTIYLPIYAGDF